MEAAARALGDLLSLAGPLWPYTWAAGFVVMTFESSRSKSAETPPSVLSRVGMLASAALPFVLFLHAFGAFILANQSGPVHGAALLPVVALVVVSGVLVLLPSAIGRAIGAAAPAAGQILHRVSPLLAIPVLAFALYVTWDNVLMILDLYVMSRTR